MLKIGKGVKMKQSVGTHYFEFSADQGNAEAQFRYAL
jgi:TPR repeat protein